MSFGEALAALDARIPERMVPDLDRMRALSDLLGEPQRTYPSIQVTGTNGKTTTAIVASEVLRGTGLGVGVYTSPHVTSVTERVLFDGAPISEKEFAATYEYLQPFFATVDAAGERVTWFEALTILAQTWFAERAADAAVFEVGMGGTWDATNLVDGRVAVLCEIALDHPELGATPAEIAVEKAGIVKEGAVAIAAEQRDDVLEVIRSRCAGVGAELRTWGSHFALDSRLLALGGQSLSFRIRDRRYEDVFLPLYGEALARDAVLAVAAVGAFLGDTELDDALVGEAFASVRSPGRMEVAGRSPLVLLDGAHNPAAAEALEVAVFESFRFERLILVAGVLDDKDVTGVLRPLVPASSVVVATKSASPRAASLDRVAAESIALGGDVRRAETVAQALAIALNEANPDDCVLVTGSLYTVAEARSVILP